MNIKINRHVFFLYDWNNLPLHVFFFDSIGKHFSYLPRHRIFHIASQCTYLSTSIGSVDLYRLRFQSCLPQCAEIIM